jgi:hypothetical protein
VRYKWYYGCLFAAFTTRVNRETGLTLLSAFKAEMNKVFQQKEAVA